VKASTDRVTGSPEILKNAQKQGPYKSKVSPRVSTGIKWTALKGVKIHLKMGVPKGHLNCKKHSKTRASTRIAPKSMASEMLGTQTRKTPINKGLKNPKHDKRAS
jgi:hypothetical protein